MNKLTFLVASLQAGLCRICKPITFMSILPYIHYINKTSGMKDNYDDTVTSTFTLTPVFCAPNVRQDQ